MCKKIDQTRPRPRPVAMLQINGRTEAGRGKLARDVMYLL